jgi:ATP-dependent DNA ligase
VGAGSTSPSGTASAAWAFRQGDQVLLQSKAGQPLGRYFPEVVEAFRTLAASRFVLDGELVVLGPAGLAFDDLLQRIHPAASRIAKLARETPATVLAFDLLVDAEGAVLLEAPLERRRAALEALCARLGLAGAEGPIRLSPATLDRAAAEAWLEGGAAGGLDGVVAKRLDAPYRSGDRRGMQKVKRLRTADCVVGGFRYAQSGGEIGSLLLGLYDEEGFCSTLASRRASPPTSAGP